MVKKTSNQELYDLKLDLDYYNFKYKTSEDINELNAIKMALLTLPLEINKLYDEINFKKDQDCNHDIWFLENEDKEYKVHSYTCKCLNCGKIKSADSLEFKHVIYLNKALKDYYHKNYDTVKQEYEELLANNNPYYAKEYILRKYSKR